jgi:hypothetical protein
MAKIIDLNEYKAKKEAKRLELERLYFAAIAKMNQEAAEAESEALDRLLWDIGIEFGYDDN